MQSRSPYSQFALGLVYTLQGHDSATSRLQVGAVPRTAGCLDIEGPGLVADSPTALEHRGRRGRSEPAAADCPGELEGLRHPPGRACQGPGGASSEARWHAGHSILGQVKLEFDAASCQPGCRLTVSIRLGGWDRPKASEGARDR
jgi:hypothetical protein